MSKINRELVVGEALDLLDEVGLDAVSTRQIARRLGVEQPALYWHFRRKEDLLAAMASEAMGPHLAAGVPAPGDEWREWFRGNFRSFRRTLLLHRDGARLHAGSFPSAGDRAVIEAKTGFLVANGLPVADVRAAMLTAGQFTLGNALEAQAAQAAQAAQGEQPGDQSSLPPGDHEQAFEAGLGFFVDGLAQRAG